MSTQEKPSLLKWYVLKAVIAALVVFVGYKAFFDNPIPEQAVPTQEELDRLSGSIELLEEPELVQETRAPETKPEEVPRPSGDQASPAGSTEPPPNLVELVQPITETEEELPPEDIDGYQGLTFEKLASFAYEVPLDPVTNKVELAKLNALRLKEIGDPEITTRIAQYEMAYRMQTSVPELADISDEPESTFKLYGEEAKQPGSHAANCLMARRLAERGVRFIQVFHRGWDHHSSLPKHMRGQCRDVDQPTAALLKDLKTRGLLEDTLVVFVGEFGRTVYGQGNITRDNYGRDHHPRCFSGWLAGGGIKGGMHYGKTDDFSYNVVENPVHVRDLHATSRRRRGVRRTFSRKSWTTSATTSRRRRWSCPSRSRGRDSRRI